MPSIHSHARFARGSVKDVWGQPVKHVMGLNTYWAEVDLDAKDYKDLFWQAGRAGRPAATRMSAMKNGVAISRRARILS
jgi:hypothetical protein